MLQIADFGISKWRTMQTSTTRKLGQSMVPGTVTHIPPEMWWNANCRATEAYDIYAYGIVLWEIFTEKEPFEGMSHFTSVSPRLIYSIVSTVFSMTDSPRL